VESPLDAIRATQLYRTLPHEIGHIVDYETKTAGLDIDDREKYWQRPSQEREAFAHRYADHFRARMFESGLCPFPRIESWAADGLRPEDFVWPKPAPTP
jgi:hypothetical protein